MNREVYGAGSTSAEEGRDAQPTRCASCSGAVSKTPWSGFQGFLPRTWTWRYNRWHGRGPTAHEPPGPCPRSHCQGTAARARRPMILFGATAPADLLLAGMDWDLRWTTLALIGSMFIGA